jgi:hypothetical protein
MTHIVTKTIRFTYGTENTWKGRDTVVLMGRIPLNRVSTVQVDMENINPRIDKIFNIRYFDPISDFIKAFVDNKFIVGKGHPAIKEDDNISELVTKNYKAGINLDVSSKYYDDHIVVDFIPTGENLASWIHTLVARYMWEMDRDIYIPKVVWTDGTEYSYTSLNDMDKYFGKVQENYEYI